MRQLLFEAPDARFPLDLCQRCHFAWFDEDELAAMPSAPPEPPPRPSLPADVRRQLAIMQVTENLAAARKRSAE